MPGSGYAVDLYQADRPLGAGFLLTRCFVLTADHCLRYLAVGEEHVSVRLGDGTEVGGRVCRRIEEADLALIEVLEPELVPLTLPVGDLPRRGDRWRGLHRPSLSDPHLGGHVDADAVDYTCVGGGRIQAMQLVAEQALGDYSGYSGGPVERVTTADRGAALLGVLIEQYPDRQAPDRAANVLFAVPLREVMSRFPHFRTDHLLQALEPPASVAEPVGRHEEQSAARGSAAPPPVTAPVNDSPGAESAPVSVDMAVAKGEALLSALKEWSERGLIDPGQVAGLQVHIAKNVVDLALGGEAS
ncbi:trypsin-like peptidase domain-containing protein [Streptomyces rectiverticillatus]|uniref:S1 family peptidase n=1 Tax=Streptomyces rectiverticillatus TaxID=173860 RepID=UPI0015C38592|nr:serine protease [Streptomyces rectiverticillatus]QLE71168.1 trypsin-like peptidase domain-containing protein [Streptomyces rectiverticillatus]